MDFVALLYLALGTFFINIPFGYLRAYKRKFSFLWFLYIHLPVPAVIFMRRYFELEFTWVVAPVEFTVYLLGQRVGIFLRKRLRTKKVTNR